MRYQSFDKLKWIHKQVVKKLSKSWGIFHSNTSTQQEGNRKSTVVFINLCLEYAPYIKTRLSYFVLFPWIRSTYNDWENLTFCVKSIFQHAWNFPENNKITRILLLSNNVAVLGCCSKFVSFVSWTPGSLFIPRESWSGGPESSRLARYRCISRKVSGTIGPENRKLSRSVFSV